jgi:hypothetical protein
MARKQGFEFKFPVKRGEEIILVPLEAHITPAHGEMRDRHGDCIEPPMPAEVEVAVLPPAPVSWELTEDEYDCAAEMAIYLSERIEEEKNATGMALARQVAKPLRKAKRYVKHAALGEGTLLGAKKRQDLRKVVMEAWNIVDTVINYL